MERCAWSVSERSSIGGRGWDTARKSAIRPEECLASGCNVSAAPGCPNESGFDGFRRPGGQQTMRPQQQAREDVCDSCRNPTADRWALIVAYKSLCRMAAVFHSAKSLHAIVGWIERCFWFLT